MLIAYPEEFPNEALLLVLDKVRGKEVDSSALAHAGWNVLGFALGKTLKVPQVAWGESPEMTPEQIILMALEDGQESSEAKGGALIPWVLVVRVVLQILMAAH